MDSSEILHGPHERGDRLLAAVLSEKNADAAYELLQEFFVGYPVDRLRLLLGSDQEWAVEAGAWIASELAADAACVRDDLVALLRHTSASVRFFAVDSIFGAAQGDEADALAEAIKLIDDPDRGVRWKVMDSLARADRRDVLAGAARLKGAEYPLLTLLRSGDHNFVATAVQGSEREQRFAAVAAGRLAIQGDAEPLRTLVHQGEEEIRQFATDLLRNLEIAGGKQA